jgi:tripartite ATP-independent transporter DctP family solute receptor
MLRLKMTKGLLISVLTFLLILSSLMVMFFMIPYTTTNVEAQSKPIVLKYGYTVNQASNEGQAHELFAELVKKKSEGRLIVETYPYDILGAGTTQIDNVVLGAQDIYAEGLNYFDMFEKDLRVFTIPFLFRDSEHCKKFWASKIGARMEASLLSRGLRIINNAHNFTRGPYRVLVSTRPVRTLKDIQGLKVRSFESNIYIRAWKQLGAVPTTITWGEVYLALRQGIVEAVAAPLSLVYGTRFTETARYVTEIHEFPQEVTMVMNEHKYQSLPDDLKKVLHDAAYEAGEWVTSGLSSATMKDVEKMKKEGVEFIKPDDLAAWAEKMVPFYKQMETEGIISSGITEAIMAIK